MSQRQLAQWQVFQVMLNNKLTQEQYKFVCKMHANLFDHKYHEPCTCSPKLIKEWITQIKKIYLSQII